ncbi:PilW family protein [Vibrio barjaei]|uniref:PilW family protein n=1 Tax=Vibrio barjaei TaxID=1676683 RepID=A0ABW7IG55_9VIBR
MRSALNLVRGVMLIELVIAMALSTLVLSALVTFYISIQRHVIERSQLLILQQALATTARRIQNDLIRSGADGFNNATLNPQGSAQTVYVSNNGMLIQYAYWDDRDPSVAKPIENVVWQFDADNQKLKICRSVSSLASGAKDISFSDVSGCTSVFEPNLVAISRFELISGEVGSSSRSNQYLKLAMEGHLRAKPSVTASIYRDFMVRNGQ